MKRLQIAQYIALGATVLSVTGIVFTYCFSGFLADFGGYLGLFGIIGAIVAYLFGGLGTALSIAGKIAKWGWLVIPFPFDIITGFCTFIFAIAALVFLPIIPVRMAYNAKMQR
ncbi:MAG: hypothetical protein NC400_04240 [Clostridium sp.]|nr:hypothetical protein [Clostridium sp.]